jgi:hypothetical protein
MVEFLISSIEGNFTSRPVSKFTSNIITGTSVSTPDIHYLTSNIPGGLAKARVYSYI